jgi:large subunit ribosomal protein L28
MSKRCDICGKEPAFGNNVSHAHNVTGRRWNPNIQKVRVIVDGSHKRLNVCTRCIRSGRVEKTA